MAIAKRALTKMNLAACNDYQLGQLITIYLGQQQAVSSQPVQDAMPRAIALLVLRKAGLEFAYWDAHTGKMSMHLEGDLEERLNLQAHFLVAMLAKLGYAAAVNRQKVPFPKHFLHANPNMPRIVANSNSKVSANVTLSIAAERAVGHTVLPEGAKPKEALKAIQKLVTDLQDDYEETRFALKEEIKDVTGRIKTLQGNLASSEKRLAELQADEADLVPMLRAAFKMPALKRFLLLKGKAK